MTELVITEGDYELAFGPQFVDRLEDSNNIEILGELQTAAIVDALPKVLANRFRRMLPDDFEIREISLKVTLSGSPFGVGISGDATLKFAPRPPDK